ncbi:MAG TPA: magnesium-translocating P-type ATPase [Cytophagaceae bacterium]|nr:magnesium-translocating P-type ATPase [Cytophagaceae bacterium]
MTKNISALELPDLLKKLDTSAEQGLNARQVKERQLFNNKKNKTPTKFARNTKLLFRQYSNPLVLLLVIAVILSAFLGETSDTFIILFILVVTGLLGFWQELNADNAVEQLRNMIHITNNVLREGKTVQVASENIVSGDIIILNSGDIVPADCRIIEANEVHVNESSLTGESFAVEKQTGNIAENEALSKKYNCLWQGTNIVSGTAKAVVVDTGKDTIFGGMAHSLTEQPETAFEKGIRGFGYFLLKITLILSVLIFSLNLYFHKTILDSILFSLALAIGMAPELLPAIMTFTMSVGAKRMMKKKVIVKKLTSIFNFGEVNLLCTDKTGTLTEGTVSVKAITAIDGMENEKAKLYASLNACLQNGLSNPIDEAIKNLGCIISKYRKVKEIPYDFIRRRLSVLVNQDNQSILITKGAVTNIMEVCTQYEENDQQHELTETQRNKIQQKLSDYSKVGLRVIAICYKQVYNTNVSREDEKEMIFLGFVVLEDPVKEGVIESIQALKRLNTTVKIITGDNRYVAAYVGEKIGMQVPKIITGEDMRQMTTEALIVQAANTDIFAEIEPQQKEQIVRALQRSRYTVAYMGDGINDVAAIHAADVGISTNNAVDVAKQAADFVLLEKDLSVLADGIYEGRKSFVNSMKYIFINTGATFGNMFSVAGASLILPFFPMLPKQILLTNFITDFPYLSVASDNVDDKELTNPGHWDLKLIRNFMIVFGLHSSLFDFITFLALYHYLDLSGSAFQTGWFLESVLSELFILFIIRSKSTILKSRPGKWLLWTSLCSFVVTVLLPLSPFANDLSLGIDNLQQVMIISFILLAYVITGEFLKIAFFSFYNKKSSAK